MANWGYFKCIVCGKRKAKRNPGYNANKYCSRDCFLKVGGRIYSRRASRKEYKLSL